MITVEQALEAIDNLDDYARMETGVDPIGPRECLISFVSQYEQLRAENEELKRRLEFAEAVIAGDRALIAGLRSELTEAKKDAERYRWLRSTDTGPSAIWELVDDDDYSPPCLTLKCGEFLDAAIDEAMKGKSRTPLNSIGRKK